MTAATPRTVEQYLDSLRSALEGADRALVQDALYDAEEHLRAELAQHPGDNQGDVLASIVASYGAPEEVADAYRSNEKTIQAALRTPSPRPRTSSIGRFFGVYADPRAYLSILYMLLALVTGTIYFTFAVTGLSMSIGLAILIIGVPFFLLFVGATRLVALAEGRLVETMLGTRMPRRPVYPDRDAPFLRRIGDMLKDPRTWGTLVYFILMLPLGRLLLHVRGRRHHRFDCHVRRADLRPALPCRHRREIDGVVEIASSGAAAAHLDPGTAAADRHDAPGTRHRLPAWPTGEDPARAGTRFQLTLGHRRRALAAALLRDVHRTPAGTLATTSLPAATAHGSSPAAASRPALCVPADEGSLHARLQGAMDAEIDWAGGVPHCRAACVPTATGSGSSTRATCPARPAAGRDRYRPARGPASPRATFRST